MNTIWLVLLLGGIVAAGLKGDAGVVTTASMNAAKAGVDTVFSLVGVMCLWMGLMKIAEKSGLMEGLAALLRPLMRRLFPSLPPEHPAMGAMLMNISANILGLGSAATPMGLKAMQELQEINPDKESASEAMCTFLTLNTCSFTLIPGTIIALRASAGAANPADIVLATLLATLVASVVGVSIDSLIRRFYWRR